MQATISIEREGDRDQGRFVLKVDGRPAGELTFVRSAPDVLIADHTWVEPAFRGKGHAQALVDAFLKWVRDEGQKVLPTCWYVRDVMQADARTHDLFAR